MLQIENLVHRYDDASHPQLAVPEFALEQGQHAVLVGPSGSGKSTLLHLLAGILTPQGGRLSIGGTDLTQLSASSADQWRSRTIGFLPQKLALIPSLTVRENILVAAYAGNHKHDTARADALLGKLGMQDRVHARPHQLSHGQRQRVALARALFQRPLLLLADEPTASLDDIAAHDAITLLRAQAEENGSSLIISTHDARVLHAMPDAKTLRLAAPFSTQGL